MIREQVSVTLAYGCCNEEDEEAETSGTDFCRPSKFIASKNPYRVRTSPSKIHTPTKISGTSLLETPSKLTAREKKEKQMACLAAGRACRMERLQKAAKDKAGLIEQKQ